MRRHSPSATPRRNREKESDRSAPEARLLCFPAMGLRERSRAAKLRACLLLLAFGWPILLCGESAGGDWNIDTARSRLTVKVLPAGLFASALHPHFFQPEDWSGEIAWNPNQPGSARVRVRFAADSLRDRQPKLSARDIARVESQVRGPDILDSARFPEVLFVAGKLEASQLPSGVSGEFLGRLAGTLTLHGRPHPVEFPIRGRLSGERLEAEATVTFRQSDFGIKPYTAALGTIAVRDEITVEVSLVAVARP